MYHEIRTQLDKIKMTEEMKGRIWESLCREETGKCRGRGFRQRIKTASAAVIACAIALGGASGVCYAVTGQSPAKLIVSIFQSGDADAVGQLEDVYKKTEESRVYENIRYTLEGYCCDRELGYAMVQMRMETVDESPFLNWDQAYDMAVKEDISDFTDLYDDGTAWRNACKSGEASYEEYSRLVESSGVCANVGFADAGYFVGDVSFEMVSENAADYFLITEFAADREGEPMESLILQLTSSRGENVGQYVLENTGTLPRITVSCPEFPGDSRMIFTGGGFLLRCDSSGETQFSLNTL